MANGGHEQALFRLARLDGGPRFAALTPSIAVIQQQLAADFLSARRMALVAVFDKGGPNLLFKELQSRIVRTHGSTSQNERPSSGHEHWGNAKSAKIAKAAEKCIKYVFAAFAPLAR